MVKEFNEEMETMMNDMRDSLGGSSRHAEPVKSIIYLTTRFSMYKLATDKIVGFLMDVDHRYGDIVQTLFKHQASIVQSMAGVATDLADRVIINNVAGGGM